MNKLSGMAIVILGVLYLGCASLPSSSNPSYYDQVREWTSTKQDVKALFGEPYHVHTGTLGGAWCETWAYSSRGHMLQFTFNPNGIVIHKGDAVASGARSTMRQTDTTQCIARTESGVICGQPAISFDAQRGPLCAKHAPAKGEERQ